MRTCNLCGCTDINACPGGCAWAIQDLAGERGICSNCMGHVWFGPLFVWDDGDCQNCGEPARGTLIFQYHARLQSQFRSCENEHCVEKLAIKATIPLDVPRDFLE